MYKPAGKTNIIINGGTDGTLITSNSNAAITNYSNWANTNNHYADLDITLNGGDSSVTVTGESGDAIIFAGGNNTLTINDTVNINGNVSVAGDGEGTLNLGTTTLTMGDSSSLIGFETINLTGTANIVSDSAFTITDGALQIGIESDVVYGQMINKSGITFSDGGVITINASSLRAITDGTTISNVFSSGTITGLTEGVLSDNSDYYTFTSVIDGDAINILIEDEEHTFDGCHNTTGTNYLCDSESSATQDFGGKDNSSISTASGFSVETEVGHGVKITGDGSLSFTDANSSTITTTDESSFGLFVKANTGSITINANSDITSVDDAVRTSNYGTGASSIALNGIVVSSAGDGLHAYNADTATSLTINTGTASSITGDEDGVFANNLGSCAISITANGEVTGTTGSGINARGYEGSTGITINTGSTSNITGHDIGIYAVNNGTGSTDVIVNGDVGSTADTGYKRAIQANIGSAGQDVTITTSASSNIDGVISAYNHGLGATFININGYVTGDVLTNSYANTTGINITTGTDSYITNIETSSEISPSYYGAIYANNQSTIDGADTNITINGDVTGVFSSAIVSHNLSNDTNIIINGGTGGTTVKSTGTSAITSDATTALDVTLNGLDSSVTIEGGDGTAIDFQDSNDTLEINGDVNINGDVTGGDGTDTLNIGTSKITMGEASTFSGFEAVNVTGEMKLQSGKTITIGSTSAIEVDGGSLKVAVASASSFGKLVSESGITFSNGGNITIDALSIGSVASGTTISNVFSGGAVTGIDAGLLSDNSLTYKFTSIINDDESDSIDILIENNSSLTSSTPNASNIASTLDTISNAGGGDAALQEVISTINSYTPSEQAAAIKTLLPNVSGTNISGTVAVSDAAIGTIENHMQTARAEINGTGIATGSEMRTKGLWAQAFGKNITQDFRNNIEGYDADVAGFTIGADGITSNNSRTGAALSYANTSAENSSSRTDINSVQATIYNTYDFGKIYYESLGAASVNHFSAARTLFDDSIAHSDYDSYQFSAKMGSGYHADFGDLKVTPFASLQYSYILLPDYTETGSSAPLDVANEDLQVLKSGLGTKIQYDIAAEDCGLTYRPYVSAAWYYDFINDTVEATSSFTSAANTVFTSRGATPERHSYNLGAGLDLLTAQSYTISLDYDFETRESFYAHTGKAKVR